MLLLLASYDMLKTVREVLILTQGGAEVKSYAAAAEAALLLLLIPAFSAVASRVQRGHLILGVTVFFVLNLRLFVLFAGTSRLASVGYFLWVGIFSVMVFAQFWAFAADLYTPDQGRRLFPLIGLGGNLGGWIGSV